MTEVCGLCGAKISTLKHSRVELWRETHHEYHEVEKDEAQMAGSHSVILERAGSVQYYDEEAKAYAKTVGFQPNVVNNEN